MEQNLVVKLDFSSVEVEDFLMLELSMVVLAPL